MPQAAQLGLRANMNPSGAGVASRHEQHGRCLDLMLRRPRSVSTSLRLASYSIVSCSMACCAVGCSLRCARRNSAAFYRIGASDEHSFACLQCGADTSSTMGLEASVGGADLVLFARSSATDGDGGRRACPIGAIPHLARTRRPSVLAWEQEVVPVDAVSPVAEADLWAIVDGSVLVGEAKSENARASFGPLSACSSTPRPRRSHGRALHNYC